MFYNVFLIIFFYFATQLQPKPKREYEERLRAEVFRWQAPELFHGYEPYKESDVYGLALLIWEMCTSKYLIKLLLSISILDHTWKFILFIKFLNAFQSYL